MVDSNGREHNGLGKSLKSLSNGVKKEVIMRCHRCNSLMVYEKFFTEEGDFFGWRCVFCGEIIDQVILKNRYQQN